MTQTLTQTTFSSPASALNLTRRLASLLLASILALAAQAQPARGVYAIQDAKIFTLAGAPLEGGTVIIRDGKISAVGTHVQIPPDAQVIDAKGLEVYPGLFDPVTLLGLNEVGQVIATVDVNE